MSTRRRVLLLVVAAVTAAACARGPAGSVAPETTFPFGAPGNPGQAGRVIEIRATDAFTFEPAAITVAVGETVTFRLINDGVLLHDFTLGDEMLQRMHEKEMMGSGAMAHRGPNVALLPAGKTVELTWTFSQPGEVLIGCHQPGHYAAGMKGVITVQG